MLYNSLYYENKIRKFEKFFESSFCRICNPIIMSIRICYP